jgi:hypothetical protein
LAKISRPLLTVYDPLRLMTGVLLVQCDLDAPSREATTNDYGGRERAKFVGLNPAFTALSRVPKVVIERTTQKLNGVPQVAVTPVLFDYHDLDERLAVANGILAALTSGGERLNGVSVAFWAAREALGQKFEPSESSWITGAVPQAKRVGPAVRTALIPWLDGRLETSDSDLYSMYHLSLPDEAHAMCSVAWCSVGGASEGQLTDRDRSLEVVLESLLQGGWISEAKPSSQSSYGNPDPKYQPGPRLRRLARWEVLVY